MSICAFVDESLDNSLIRVDMSEYMEKHTVSKLIGSPPGYGIALAVHLSFTVLYAIGHWVVFRVGGWSPHLPTRFHVSGRTLDPAQLSPFSPTWFSHSLTGLPMPFG